MDLDIKKQFDEIKADIAEFFSFFSDNVATKEDLKAFATKEDLKAFATKEDLKAFATKEDLKAFATKEDLKNGLDAIRNELRSIDDRLTKLEIKVDALSKGSTEDIDMLASDYVYIRRRLNFVVEALKKNGIEVPELEVDKKS